MNLIILENALPEKDLELIETEIKNATFNNESKDHLKFTRWYPPPKSSIANIIENLIYSDKVRKLAVVLDDYAMRSLADVEHCNFATGFEVQVTKYKKGDHYLWHVDHGEGRGRLLNYILYLYNVENGGELQLTKETDISKLTNESKFPISKTIKPTRNMLVIMPAHYFHKVNMIKGDQERITINGHIRGVPKV